MSAPRYRLPASDLEYGDICECGGLKARQHRRCKDCDTEQRRARPAYWRTRTCPDCGGPKTRGPYRRCRHCENESKRGKPRTSPVVVPVDHPWRR
jgi:hypothetical protein